jgi:hypothetical protein
MSRPLPSRPTRLCRIFLCCGLFTPLWYRFQRFLTRSPSSSYSAAHAQLEEMEFELDNSGVVGLSASEDDSHSLSFSLTMELPSDEEEGRDTEFSSDNIPISSSIDLCRSIVSCIDNHTRLPGKVTDSSIKLIFDTIGSRGFSLILQSLIDNQTMKSIEFGINNIGSAGHWNDLQRLCSQNHTLQSIQLWGNGLNDGAIQAISKGIQENQTSSLTFLSLANNEITDIGIKSLINSLDQLKHLDLSGNIITDVGIYSLINQWKMNNKINLEYLNVSSNRLTNKSAILFSESLLIKYSCMDTLDLSSNLFDDEGIVELCKCLKENKTLTQLNIAGNKMNQLGKKAIQNALKQAKQAKLHRLIIAEVNENLSLGVGVTNGAISEAESSEGNGSNGHSFPAAPPAVTVPPLAPPAGESLK